MYGQRGYSGYIDTELPHLNKKEGSNSLHKKCLNANLEMFPTHYNFALWSIGRENIIEFEDAKDLFQRGSYSSAQLN